jgi:hypothetical protein
MQLCDLDDLYRKFEVVKMLRIGNTEKPHFNYSDGLSVPESEYNNQFDLIHRGDVLYERSKFDMDEKTPEKAPAVVPSNTNPSEPITESNPKSTMRSVSSV